MRKKPAVSAETNLNQEDYVEISLWWFFGVKGGFIPLNTYMTKPRSLNNGLFNFKFKATFDVHSAEVLMIQTNFQSRYANIIV